MKKKSPEHLAPGIFYLSFFLVAKFRTFFKNLIPQVLSCGPSELFHCFCQGNFNAPDKIKLIRWMKNRICTMRTQNNARIFKVFITNNGYSYTIKGNILAHKIFRPTGFNFNITKVMSGKFQIINIVSCIWIKHFKFPHSSENYLER